mmetsp:Transcript_86991/g.159234  ORF Transcript_86991/g.159234 Transcript_86991/m.159234 type:complete len:192 (-) Transcript_86991:72-647(-)
MSHAPRQAGVSVAIDARSASKESLLDAHKFTIRVRNGWSTTKVKRRYSEFVELDQQLRPKMSSLPEMPPKSFMRKLLSPFVLDPSFMNERQKGLRTLLEAMVSQDPALRCPELREFLGVSCCAIPIADDISLCTKTDVATQFPELTTEDDDFRAFPVKADVVTLYPGLQPTLLQRMHSKSLPMQHKSKQDQ